MTIRDIFDDDELRPRPGIQRPRREAWLDGA